MASHCAEYRFFTSLLALGILVSCAFPEMSGNAEKGPSLSAKEEGLLRVAHATESGGDLASAERLYKQAVAMSGKKTGARMELAEFYKRNHADYAAIPVLQEAHNLQPKNMDILRELANTEINAGEPDKALELLNGAVAANPKDALLYNSRGVALDMSGQYGEAQKSYQQAIQINPADQMTYKTNLSMSYILSGSYNEAIDLLMPLLAAPDVTPTIRQNLALAYGLKGESDKALKLGLKDLSIKEAEENLKFYRTMAASQQSAAKKLKPMAKTVPVLETIAPVTTPEIPTEDDELDEKAELTPKNMVHKQTKEEDDEDDDDKPVSYTGTVKPTLKTLPAETLPQNTPVATPSAKAPPIPHGTLPQPVLKPDNL